MAAVVIAQDIASYLQAMKAGTVGTDICYDTQPDEPDDCITVYDAGGPAPDAPPESWREMYIQVRSADHATGYEKVWCILNYILEPTDGIMTVGLNQYIAQLEEIPSIFNRDQNGRFLFSFRVIVYNIAGTVTADPWSECLVNWTKTQLGTGWNVYGGFKGNKRPAVSWLLNGIQISDNRGRAAYLMKKQFTGIVLARTPNEHASAAATIIGGLSDSIKIALDEVNKKYLTVVTPTARTTGKANLLNQVTLTLQRVTSRPQEEVATIDTVILSKGNITI